MKEKVYDDQISPLMTQIIEICHANKIAMIADFKLDDDLACTTAILLPEYDPRQAQLDAARLLKPQSAWALAVTTETLPDGTKKVTATRVR